MLLSRRFRSATRPGKSSLVALALSLAVVRSATAEAELAIRLLDDNRTIALVGLDPTVLERLEVVEEPLLDSELFAVTVLDAEVPMIGRYQIVGNQLHFVLRFGLRSGVQYRVVFQPALLPGGDPDDSPIAKILEIPRPKQLRATEVVTVYPTADLLPENLLRFYIQFSSPMSQGEAYEHIKLLDHRGNPIVAPFLELDEELWDPNGTRFTLLIDPGRIKQGLVPHEEMGPVLKAGRQYTLRVDQAWPDASGTPLSESYQKVFRTGPLDDEPPDPVRWRIDPPASSSRDPLVVIFPEPLDHALAGRLIQVFGPSRVPLQGEVTVDRDATRWRFEPENPWAPGNYQLVVSTDLEDLVGNGVGRPFEVDVFDRVTATVEEDSVRVLFQID